MKAKELLKLMELEDSSDLSGKQWIISTEGELIDPEFEYSKNSNKASAWLKDLMKDHPGCEITQLGYEDISVMLPPNTSKQQAQEVAQMIADKLPKSSDNRDEWGADVTGYLYDIDQDGAAMDIDHDEKPIHANKGEKMGAPEAAKPEEVSIPVPPAETDSTVAESLLKSVTEAQGEDQFRVGTRHNVQLEEVTLVEIMKMSPTHVSFQTVDKEGKISEKDDYMTVSHSEFKEMKRG